LPFLSILQFISCTILRLGALAAKLDWLWLK
jgi:hypothetical protein